MLALATTVSLKQKYMYVIIKYAFMQMHSYASCQTQKRFKDINAKLEMYGRNGTHQWWRRRSVPSLQLSTYA